MVWRLEGFARASKSLCAGDTTRGRDCYRASRVADWRRRVTTDIQAARLAAAQIGIPGQSFEAVVDELRKPFSRGKDRSRETNPDINLRSATPAELRVRMPHLWLGDGNKR